MLSPKQEIYREILRFALPWIRNATASSRLCTAEKLRAIHEEAEYVHELPNLILEWEYTSGDVSFLDTHARIYLERADPQLCLNYNIHRGFIRDLFALVPQELQGELQWSGPDADHE